MRAFLDTSVLVAAFVHMHVHHRASVELLASAAPEHSVCGVHTLAEVYATMTALPVQPMIPPEQAMLFLEEIRNRLTLVVLNEEEYFDTIRKTAEHGFTTGRVYDALLLQCAVKAKAQIIYTWNVKHFQALAPHLADRIRKP